MRGGRAREERGAAIVEMAFVAPLLLALIFGVIEFGWGFGQRLDVRHGAREAARLVAVNYRESGGTGATQGAQIVDATCERMDLSAGAEVTLARSGTRVGDTATVTVRAELDDLTGFFGALLDVTLSSTVETRLERAATWSPLTRACP